ncbi:hypothetical protein QMT40_000389 [Parvibaculaceae bacterium PLY_AMNH_Bact1]|nr:hypothetical protein QMT40_000389 [Parvibaculaceae bacterium PLY_AMNH_Bact1]
MTGPDHTTDKDAEMVGAVHDRAKELDRHILEHSRGAEAGDTVAGGYAARGAVKPDSGGGANGKKKSGEMVQAVMDATAAMERDLKRLYEEQERLYDRLSDLELKIDKLDQARNAVENGDLPEIGPDGRLKDAELEALISAQEKRLGRSIDRSDPQALLVIFTAEQERSIVERTETMEAIDRNEAEIKAAREGREIDETLDTGLSGAGAILENKSASLENPDQTQVAREFDQFTF